MTIHIIESRKGYRRMGKKALN